MLTKALSTPLPDELGMASATRAEAGDDNASANVAESLAPAPVAKAKAKPMGKPLSRKRPRIPDIDQAIEMTAAVVEQAKKGLRAAAVQRKNAQRRRSRLVAKAAKLPADDLYKIAVYKRTNFLAHILENNQDTLKANLASLVDDTDPQSVQQLLKHLADVAGAPKRQSKAQGQVEDMSAALVPVPGSSASAASAGLPVVAPLAAPERLEDGSEEFAEPRAGVGDSQAAGAEPEGVARSPVEEEE